MKKLTVDELKNVLKNIIDSNKPDSLYLMDGEGNYHRMMVIGLITNG